MQKLRKVCKCGEYHNPDYLLVKCNNEGCGLWQHEACLVKDALERFSDRKVGKANGTDTTEVEALESIKVDDKEEKLALAIRTTGTQKSNKVARPTAKNTRGEKGKGKKGRRASCYEGAKPWEGKLNGSLELKKEKNEDKEVDEVEATGRVIVRDLRGETPVEHQIDMLCVHCGKRIQ